jgi:hypothetical protein
LLDSADPDGMLPQNHPAEALSFILLAVTLGLCFFLIRRIRVDTEYARLFPASRAAAMGSILGAVGMGCAAFFAENTGLLFLPVIIFGAISTICLGVAAYLRLHEIRPNCLLHCLPAAYIMFRTITFCRIWGTEPQLQLYFFELLAAAFLLLACYYRAELDVKDTSCKKYLFFSQTALFCCCLCLPGEDRLFYLSALIWLIADRCVLSPSPQEA